MNRRVLLVDDESRVLDGYRRNLYRRFDISVATSGTEGLQLVESAEPFAVVVSDYRMPGMDGVAFLTRVRSLNSDTVRVLLTGQADQQATIAAINEGDIFRFLSKPCPPDVLAKTLEAGIEQFRLVNAERELLEQTLAGSVEVLMDVLGLVAPETYRMSARLQETVRRITQALDLEGTWEYELAASLSQLGTVALPAGLLRRLRTSMPLRAEEEALIEQHPQSAYNLLAKIPRLERVAEMILKQRRPPGNRPRTIIDPDDEDRIAIGAHLLHVVLEYEDLVASGRTPSNTTRFLRSREGPKFRLQVLDVLETLAAESSEHVRKALSVESLAPGMVLDEDVKLADGRLLLAQGETLSQARVERIRRFHETVGVLQPVPVLVPTLHVVS